MSFANRVLDFLRKLNPPATLPAGVEVMNPYLNPAAWDVTRHFYQKFYSDDGPRVLIIGINPGRFGGGITGVPFTDPINLADECKIINSFRRRPELSSRFIYRMIKEVGGVSEFYRQYFITATCPLGFTRGGKNLNYYDLPELQKTWSGFMLDCLKQQAGFNTIKKVAFVLGQGKNYKYLLDLNQKHKLFDGLEILPHPRWVMQYRLKHIDQYLELYKEKLQSAVR